MTDCSTGDLIRARVSTRTQDTLGHLFSRASRLFLDQAVQAVHAHGYTEVRLRWIDLLRHLHPDGARTSVLARRLQITKQAAGQLVDEVERAGYVERVPDPSDGRAKIVRMTERGWAAWLAGLESLKALERELEEEVGAEAIAALQAHGHRLLAALERRSLETR